MEIYKYLSDLSVKQRGILAKEVGTSADYLKVRASVKDGMGGGLVHAILYSKFNSKLPHYQTFCIEDMTAFTKKQGIKKRKKMKESELQQRIKRNSK